MPDSGEEDWVVRCPLCSAEYSLAEVLGQRPPALQIVKSKTAAETPSTDFENRAEPNPFAKFQVGQGVDRDLANFQLDTGEPQPVSDSYVPAVDSMDTSSAKSSESQSAEPRRRTSMRRESRRAEKNPLLEFTKIVLGGLLALPVAQLIFWWGVKTDPIKLGPKVSKIAPFVVPAQFHDNSIENGTKQNDDSTNKQLPDSVFDRPTDKSGNSKDGNGDVKP